MAGKPMKTIGRPKGYKAAYHDKLVYRLAASGNGDTLIAEAIDISPSTFDQWKVKHKTLMCSLTDGKKQADDMVEASLYHRAIGYKHKDTHVSAYMGDVTLTPIEKIYPPEPGAIKMWLTNRRPKEWRERTEIETSGSLTIEAGDSISALVRRIREARQVEPIPIEQERLQA
jgi:hypothetical protein